MNDIKIRYVYSNGKEIKIFIYTIEEIESNCVYEETTGFSKDFELISRDYYTGLKDKNNEEQINDTTVVVRYEVENIDCLRFGEEIYFDKSSCNSLGLSVYSLI